MQRPRLYASHLISGRPCPVVRGLSQLSVREFRLLSTTKVSFGREKGCTPITLVGFDLIKANITAKSNISGRKFTNDLWTDHS